MGTDSENKKQLEQIGQLLGLEMIEKNDQNFSGNSASFKVNDQQSLWVKLYGYRGKGHAQLSPLAEHRRGSDSPYFDSEKAYLSISFAENKAPEAIAKDVTRRLLKNPDAETARKYIEEKIGYFNDGKKNEAELKKELQKLGFDCRDSKSGYYNKNGLYIVARFENGSLYIERFSPSKDKGLEIMAAIIAANKGAKQ